MNILLITPFLNDYYVDIQENLKYKGHNVKWYSCGIKKSNIQKFYNIFNSKYIINKYDAYIDQIISQNKNFKVDKIIIIFAGEVFGIRHVNKFKKAFKNCEFIYYNWDSVRNYPSIKDFYSSFDRYYSFDKIDCIEYGFEFLPLFYCNTRINSQPNYDVFSIMTYNSHKEKDYKRIKSKLPDNLRCKEYLLIPNKVKYLIDRLLNKSYLKGIPKEIIFHNPMNRQEVYEAIADSKVVLDTPRENQNGLTIRTFEVLNQRRKLITTNTSIKDYDFYCEDNIFVVTDSTEAIPKTFFDKPFNENYCLTDKYSINTFVDILLNGGVENE